MAHHVIGCGGIGSHLVEKIIRLDKRPTIILYDGDKLEAKNLDRQRFSADEIGKNKAEALAKGHGLFVLPIPEFFHTGSEYVESIGRGEFLWCCADNHAARRAVLEVCDAKGCRAIIGGNRFTDSEAYWYEPAWRDGPNDPRIFYPELATSDEGNPLSAGCTGVIADENPQLSMANDMASALMISLYWFHTRERRELPAETSTAWPVHLKSNVFRLHTIKKGDRQ